MPKPARESSEMTVFLGKWEDGGRDGRQKAPEEENEHLVMGTHHCKMTCDEIAGAGRHAAGLLHGPQST